MSNQIAWKNIKWREVHRRVNKFQHRIYKVSKKNNIDKVHFLQKILINSLDAKLLAVKWVIKEKEKSLSDITNKHIDNAKIKLIKKLKIDGKANSIKKVYISKYAKLDKNFLEISVIEDKAKQYLVLLALEPEWEAKFEPNSYGFRPGRSYRDAVLSIFENIKLDINKSNFKKYILHIDFKKCFDNINYKQVLKKLNSIPIIQNQIKTWLEIGIIKNYYLSKLKQKSINKTNSSHNYIISPFIINIILHGIEYYINEYINSVTERSKSTNQTHNFGILRYANDFILIHKNKNIIIKLKYVLLKWLKKHYSLELTKAKINIFRSTEGFIFLGFKFINIKRYNRIYVKIYPDKSSVINLTKKIGQILRINRAISSYDLISILKPIIISWCNYYSISECSNLFKKLDYLTYQMLRAWVFRRDKLNNRTKIKEKYFPPGNKYIYFGKIHYDNWVLVGQKTLKKNNTIDTIFLPKFSWTQSIKYIKIQPHASFFDGNEIYWKWRIIKYRNLLKIKY